MFLCHQPSDLPRQKSYDIAMFFSYSNILQLIFAIRTRSLFDMEKSFTEGPVFQSLLRFAILVLGALICILTCVLFSSIGYFNGCGKSIPVMIQGITSAFCIRIPVSIIMSRLPETSLTYVGMATPISSRYPTSWCSPHSLHLTIKNGFRLSHLIKIMITWNHFSIKQHSKGFI